MKSFRTVILLLALVLLATQAFATGVQQTPAAQAGPAPITMSQAQQLWGGSLDASLQLAFVDVLQRATNTRINVIAPPHNDYTQRLNVLLSSGDIPDLYHIYAAMKSVPTFARRGYLAELDPIISRSQTLSSVYSGVYEKISVIDGKTWAIPDGTNSRILMFLRKDFLDAAGVAVPTTIDQFYDALVKLRAAGYGPFSNARFMSYFRFFLSSFGGYDDIIRKDGRFVDGYTQPEVRAGLAWLNKLYTEGLLDKEWVTYSTGNMRDQFYAGKSVGNVYWDFFYTTYQNETRKVNPDANVIPIYRLAGPGGPGYTTDWGIDGAWGVSPRSANKEAAVRIVEWFNTSEGFIARYAGVEGRHYTVGADRTAVPTDLAKNSGYALNVFNFLRAPFRLDLPFSFGPAVEALAESQRQVNASAQAAIGPYYSVPPGLSDIYDRNGPSLDAKRNELSTQMIIGAKSIDEGFAEYAAFWRSIDGDRMLQEMNW